ncbi:MAG: hypothetical protein HYS44_02990 [Candidatus Niyogibacteria bacterium]|nr:hypothetical protein [Candidatus Niyogibacteria bacterium]
MSWENGGGRTYTVAIADETAVRALYAILKDHAERHRAHDIVPVHSIRVFDASSGKELDPENNFDFKGEPHDAERN